MDYTRYVVITPARNEEQYIQHTLDSMDEQTLKPARWIVVDDDSSDQTAAIVEEYARTRNWVTLVRHRPTPEERNRNIAPVIAAFYSGYHTLESESWDFIVKLDADLTLPPRYFESVAGEFRDNPRTGICGGYIVQFAGNGTYQRERAAEYHVRGAFKAYRRECFREIGGISLRRSWDGIDQYTALYHGWKTRVLPLEVIHHRRTGSTIDRGLGISFMVGREYYREGHGALLGMIRSVLWGKNRKPLGVTGAVFLAGFALAWVKREGKYVDADMERFIRRFQYGRILRKMGIGGSPDPVLSGETDRVEASAKSV